MDNNQTKEVDTYVNQLINNVVNDFLSDDEAPDIEGPDIEIVEETTVVVDEQAVEETTVVEEEPVQETAVVEETTVVEEESVVEEDSVEETTVDEEPVVEEDSVEETIVVEESVVKEEPVRENNVKINIKEDDQEDLKNQIKALELLVSNLMDKKKENAPMNEIVIEETVVEEVVKPESPVATKAKSEIPEIVIIVPYRDREPQRSAFMKIMPHIVEDLNCKILFVHQRDRRPFNRGAMKNLGFIFVKNMYPNHYKDITLVFHDIDNMPWYKGQFSYQTGRNIINHFYGFPHALGGVFAIKGWDFEHLNGFPNFWTWGLEDNMIQRRAEQYGKRIIRPQFVNIEKSNKNIIGLWHGWDRLINPHIEHKGRADKGQDGIRSLYRVGITPNKIDDLFIEVNVTSFQTGESLNSPYVKGARVMNARHAPRLNRPFYVKAPKRGTAGTFGKKKGFGGMAF